MILGSIFFSKIISKIRNNLFFSLINVLVIGASLILFINMSANLLYLSIFTIFIFGIALSFFNTNTRTILHTKTPASLMGRVAGITRTLTTAASSTAILFGSFASSMFPPAYIVTLLGGSLLIICIIMMPYIYQMNTNLKTPSQEVL